MNPGAQHDPDFIDDDEAPTPPLPSPYSRDGELQDTFDFGRDFDGA